MDDDRTPFRRKRDSELRESLEKYTQYLEGRTTQLDARTRRYIICKAMHWDYYTYQVQPDEFLVDVWAMLNLDVRKERRSTSSEVGYAPQQDRSRTPTIRRAPKTGVRRYK